MAKKTFALKATDPAVQQIEERIRQATDSAGLDQKHVDRLVDVGIEVFLFELCERVNDAERRIAALEQR